MDLRRNQTDDCAPAKSGAEENFPGSGRYDMALLFAFVRIFSSSGVNPGGKARFDFLVVL